MEQEGAVGELEEEEEGAVDEWEEERAQSTLSCLTQRKSWRCSGNLT